MSEEDTIRSSCERRDSKRESVLYKVVLTGGPCAGKTTTVARLRTFFENLGWKVYTVPEAATILLGGGVKYSEVSPIQAQEFNRNILKTILQLETTFFEMAAEDKRNVIVVCDRGTYDPSAFCPAEEWHEIISSLGWDSIQLRDARYDQVVHMMTAASGAEQFYQLANNSARSEGIELARELDTKAAQAWVGHPYYDVIDNSTDFESKIRRVIEVVCKRIGKQLGADIDDRLKAQSKKRKFLVKSLPDSSLFSKVEDFDVTHDYLLTSNPQLQARVRKRGQNGYFTFTHTERRTMDGKRVEQIMQLSDREYRALLNQRDPTHHPIHKKRKCFLWKGHYFQLDVFLEPCSQRCQDMLMLETYTTKQGDELELPDFLEIVKEVTSDPHYSMYYLSAQD
ncbi:TRPL translocation defect protein 14-like isoform X1 [Halichondria panicea]|uniref:TRPL translocation defect protein 14-like isoform X1 n=1 Tax=Halichondria panicea TaxID=6063 RepID=UPI00312B6E27